MSLIAENFSSVKTMTIAQSAVIRTLIYFDIFKHPLKEAEILNLIQSKSIPQNEIHNAIAVLIRQGLIGHDNGFYFLNNNTGIVERRLRGEIIAAQYLKTAKRYSKLISKFPFVRAIALSGSLSKNFMNDESDIDYFIITAKSRMWVARTLLILYKKIFLFNSHKYFCVNYFLSEDSLEVPDKNIFTATEVSFLIPTYNYNGYNRFREANTWVRDHLPNFPMRGLEHIIEEEKRSMKAIIEKILSGFFGEKLDNFFFRLTVKFWKKKFKHFDDITFDFRLRSRKNVSKHHPLGFQEKVLSSYAKNIQEFTHAHHISLHAEDPVYA